VTDDFEDFWADVRPIRLPPAPEPVPRANRPPLAKADGRRTSLLDSLFPAGRPVWVALLDGEGEELRGAPRMATEMGLNGFLEVRSPVTSVPIVVERWGLFDAAEGGNLLFEGSFTSRAHLSPGDQFQVHLQIRVD
jgi:hypothetical protein